MGSRLIMDLAILPGIILLVLVYRQDKIEKEPIGLIIKLILAGAATVVSALVLESLGDYILNILFYPDTILYLLLENIIVVACVEEGGKYLVTKALTWRDVNFNYRFDGIVYCLCASMGFAIVENIAYASSYGLANVIVRAFTAVPAHAIFGIMMGHFYGYAKEYDRLGDERRSRRFRKRAYIMPVIFHGLYDVFAGDELEYGFIIFLILVIAMYIWAIKRVGRDSREDERI